MTKQGFVHRYILLAFIAVLMSPQIYARDFCRDLKRKYDIPVRLIMDQSGYVDELKRMLRFLPDFHLGWISSDTIGVQVNNLSVCLNVSEAPLAGSGLRQGSVYFTEERIIVINRDRLQGLDKSPEKKYLLLHETLGALGYPDENYQLTTFIMAKSQQSLIGDETVDVIHQELTRDLMREPRRIQNIITQERSGEGGISGVGGGGEPEAAVLKPLMIETLFNHSNEFEMVCGGNERRADIVRFILRLRIESDGIYVGSKETTPYKDLFIGAIESEEILLIRDGSWLERRRLGREGEKARSEYLKSLVSLACILEAGHGKP